MFVDFRNGNFSKGRGSDLWFWSRILIFFIVGQFWPESTKKKCLLMFWIKRRQHCPWWWRWWWWESIVPSFFLHLVYRLQPNRCLDRDCPGYQRSFSRFGMLAERVTKELAETGNRARKDSGTQGNFGHKKRATEICDIFPSIPNDFWENDGR